jgi:serine/threonine protein kinase
MMPDGTHLPRHGAAAEAGCGDSGSARILRPPEQRIPDDQRKLKGSAAMAGGGALSEDFPALTGFRADSLLAGYRLETQVGAGGFAVVFRARGQRPGRLVALKILAPGLGTAPRTGWRTRFAPTSRTSPADVRLPARSCRCGARRLPPIPS